MNRAVERAIMLLDYFSHSNYSSGVGISQLSRDLNIPKSSISDIVYTLMDLGYLQYDNVQLKTFRIGNNAIKLGLTTLKKYDFLEIARPWLEQLYKLCGHTVYVGIETGDCVTIVEKLEGHSIVGFTDGIGSTKPLHLTALGKALLAGYADDEILSIVGDTCYEIRTRNSLPNARALLKDISATRLRGYALENFEANEYLYGIAAPIINFQGNVCASIGINIFSPNISVEKIPELTNSVRNTAEMISRDLGATSYTYFDIKEYKK